MLVFGFCVMLLGFGVLAAGFEFWIFVFVCCFGFCFGFGFLGWIGLFGVWVWLLLLIVFVLCWWWYGFCGLGFGVLFCFDYLGLLFVLLFGCLCVYCVGVVLVVLGDFISGIIFCSYYMMLGLLGVG